MEKNNIFFIQNVVEKIKRGESSLFLNITELNHAVGLLNKNKITYSIYYPYPNAEKVIIYNEHEPSVSLLEIKTKNPLKHSDILGSLFANQINPNQYGDILIIDGRYYIIVLSSLVNYFLTGFSQVGGWNVSVEEKDMSEIAHFEHEYDTLYFLVTSLRIDNVVSVITHLSRARVEEMFDDKQILLQYELCKRFRILNEGDIISIRKYGKYKFNGVISKNAKGKLRIEVLKYK